MHSIAGVMDASTLEDLPLAARDRVGQLDIAWSGRFRPRPTTQEGNRLDLPKFELIFLSDTPPTSGGGLLFERLLLIPWPLGFALSIYTAVAERWEPAPIWQWVLVGGLVVFGALCLGARSVLAYRRASQPMQGLILAPEGMVRLDPGGRYRFIPRADVHDAALTSDGVSITMASGQPVAVTGGDHSKPRLQLIEAWRRAEGVVHTTPSIAFGAKLPIAGVFGYIAAVAAVTGLLFATLVYPGRSEAGVRTQAFFDALRNKQFDTAHGLLTPDARQRTPKDAFQASLPSEFLAQRGVSINGVASAHGTRDETRGCVDGWLDVPGAGSSPMFRVLYRSRGDLWAIHSYAVDARCLRATWLKTMADVPPLE
jgi:hypothetical protein